MTTDEFIERSQSVHGDLYDYSLVNYTGYRNKVQIICRSCGIFDQSPQLHLRGHGCNTCGDRNRTHSTETFISKANIVHGELYDYSNVSYTDAHTKVAITCKQHGDFLQTPNKHLDGRGCPECKRMQARMNVDEFIKRSNNIHSSKYDYSNVNYRTSKHHVDIICSVHGLFKQTPDSHLKGYGCLQCGTQNKSENACLPHIQRLFPNSEIIQSARVGWLGAQHLDFYIPEHNVAFEYHGKQHYEAIPHWGGDRELLIQQKRDDKKRMLCKENNTTLYEISCYDFDFNTDEHTARRVFGSLILT